MDSRIEELYYVISSIYPAWSSVIGPADGRGYSVWASRLYRDIDYVQKLINDFVEGRLDEMIPNKQYGPSLVNLSGIIKHYKAGEIAYRADDKRDLMSNADANAMFAILKECAKVPAGYKHDRRNCKRGDFERYLDASMPIIKEDMREQIKTMRKKMDEAKTPK